MKVRIALLCVCVSVLSCGAYWWKAVRPFFAVERSMLYSQLVEIRAEEAGKLLECALSEGARFDLQQQLFSVEGCLGAESVRAIDRKRDACIRQSKEEKQKLDLAMEQYICLQNQPEELMSQFLEEAHKAQEKIGLLEDEMCVLENERLSVAMKREMMASFEGTVLHWVKRVGEHVSSGEPVVLVCKKDRWVEAQIPETMLLKVKIGSSAVITFPSFPGKKWKATVSWVSHAVVDGQLSIRLTAEDFPYQHGLTAKTYLQIH